MVMYRTLVLSLALMAATGGAAGQSNDLPPGVFMGGKDLAEVRAGTYAIDPDHSAVLARVSHIRYSYLVVRFDKVSGKLTWDPAAPEKSTLSVRRGCTIQISAQAKASGPALSGFRSWIRPAARGRPHTTRNNPATSPTHSNLRVSRNTRRLTSPAVAPNAMRTPISFVRRATLNASSP